MEISFTFSYSWMTLARIFDRISFYSTHNGTNFKKEAEKEKKIKTKREKVKDCW